MNPQLQVVLERLRTKPPNIPAVLFANINDIAEKYGDEYPLVGDKIEREIIKGSVGMLKSNIPLWVYDLNESDWKEFIEELSRIPHFSKYLVWIFSQLKIRLR